MTHTQSPTAEALPLPALWLAWNTSYTGIRFWTADAAAAEAQAATGLALTGFYSAEQMRAAIDAMPARSPFPLETVTRMPPERVTELFSRWAAARQQHPAPPSSALCMNEEFLLCLDAFDRPANVPAWPCHCDERGIGVPGETCGDCPRDYGHTVDSAPSGEPPPSRDDLIAALQFYAAGNHRITVDESAWDTVSGEPVQWLANEAGDMVEDGTIAAQVLAGALTAEDLADEDDDRATTAPAPLPRTLTEEQIERHEMPASECPPNSQVILVSSIRRLLGLTAAETSATASVAGLADWTTPTTVQQRMSDAVTLLCAGKRPPDDMVAGWLDRDAEDGRLQEFAIEHGPAWAQGIALLDAAWVMVDQPTEGVDHEHAAPQAVPVPAPSDDWQHLKPYGYAPGNYMSKCHRCEQVATGLDKRAVTCRPCAEVLHAARAASPAPAVPAEPDRAWLVEWRWNGVQWLYLIGRRFSFTADPNAALRFARRADAEAALAWVEAHDGTGAPRRLGEMLATEHEWAAATPQEAPARQGLTEAACQWRQEDEGSGTYWSACGHGFTFNDGGPTDNCLKHCCYCGKPLIELPWVEPEPDAGIATPAAPKE